MQDEETGLYISMRFTELLSVIYAASRQCVLEDHVQPRAMHIDGG